MEIEKMDSLCDRILQTQFEIAELEEMIDEKKAQISEIKKQVEQFFIETKREAPYQSPYGTLYLNTDLSVRQPTTEGIRKIFAHWKALHGEDYAWEKLSIHNATLKAEIKEHNAAVIERGGDPILEPFPGVEPAVELKQLRFRKPKSTK